MTANFASPQRRLDNAAFTRQRPLRLVVWVVAVGLALSTAVQPQTMVTPNPSDLLDARLALINPAAAAMQDPLFNAGLQALHTGVGENAFSFRNNFFGLTATERTVFGLKHLAMGVQAQVLTTPVMHDLAFNAVLGKKISERFSAGVSVGSINRSFSNFDLEGADPNDPLLRNTSQWAPFSLGAGVLFNANRYLKLGAVANRINTPNIAFEDGEEARVSRYLSAGALVGFNSFVTGLAFSHENHELSSQVYLQYFHLERGYAKVGYTTEAIAVEGQLHVTSGVSFNYRYNYPINDLNIASNGSHELGLSFNFKKRPLPYEPEWLKPPVPLPDPIAMVDLFQVMATVDSVKIVDTYITRVIDQQVKPEERADLPRKIFYSNNSLKPETLEKIFLSTGSAPASAAPESAARMLEKLDAEDRAAGRPGAPTDSAAIEAKIKERHSENYLQALRSLAARLREPDFRTTVIVPHEAYRAQLILRYIQLYGPVTDNNLLAARVDSAKARQQDYLGAAQINEQDFERKLSTPGTMFNFSLKNTEESLRWGPMSGRLIIEDAFGKVWYDSTVAKRKNKKDLPQILAYLPWDWKVRDGDYPPAGNYYYYVLWKSADGSSYRSPKRKIVVDRRPERIYQRLLKEVPADLKPKTKATVQVNP